MTPLQKIREVSVGGPRERDRCKHERAHEGGVVIWENLYKFMTKKNEKALENASEQDLEKYWAQTMTSSHL